MKRLLLGLAFLLSVAAPAEASWSYVSGTTVVGGHVITWAPTATGNLLVIGYANNLFNDALNVGSDTCGNAWARIGTPLADPTNTHTVTWFYAVSTGTASCTITMDSNGTTAALWLAEYHSTGTVAASTLDVANQNSAFANNSGSTVTGGDVSGSITTTQAGDLIVSWILNTQTPGDGTVFFTAGSAYTSRNPSSLDSSATRAPYRVEDLVQPATGSIQGTWTSKNTNAYGAMVVAFREATGTTQSVTLDFISQSATGDSFGIERCTPQLNPFTCFNFQRIATVPQVGVGVHQTYVDTQSPLAGACYRTNDLCAGCTGNSNYTNIGCVAGVSVPGTPTNVKVSVAVPTGNQTFRRTVTWTDGLPTTQDSFSIFTCSTHATNCTPGSTPTATLPAGATSFDDTPTGLPVTCYQFQANLAGTPGSGLSTPVCGIAVPVTSTAGRHRQ